MTNAANSNQGDFGYGQQDPTTPNNDFNMTAFLVAQMISRIDTMKLVKVMAVTAGEGDPPAAGTVDVMPLVNQIDGNGNSTPHGTVYGVPWTRMQGGKNAVIADPEVGDLGFVVVSDRDISSVKNTKKQGNPGSRRKYNLADGVYIGGILNVAPEQFLQFTADGCRLVDKSGNSVAMSSAGIVIKAASGMPVRVDGNLVVGQNLQIAGEIQGEDGGTYGGAIRTSGAIVAGAGTGDEVTVQQHTHEYDRPTGGSTPAQTDPPTGGT